MRSLLLIFLLVLLVVSTSGTGNSLRLMALKLLKMKLFALKAPFLLPLKLAALAKVAATGHFAKKLAFFHQARFAAAEFPMRALAMKYGAIHGANAGWKAGLAAYNTPTESFGHPPVFPASYFLNRPIETPVPESSFERKAPSYVPAHSAPAYTPAPPAYTPAPPAYTPAPPAYTPAPPAYTPAPPAYTPAPEVHYRKRREAESMEDQNADEVIRGTFHTIQSADEQRCVPRTVCEIAVEPSIARGFGNEILNFLSALSDDEAEPWRPLKSAMTTGAKSKSREICVREYPHCTMSSEELVEQTLENLEEDTTQEDS